MVGDQFKVYENRIGGRRFEFFQEKMHDLQASFDIQVEGAVDKFETSGTAPVKRIHFMQKFTGIESPGCFVQ